MVFSLIPSFDRGAWVDFESQHLNSCLASGREKASQRSRRSCAWRSQVRLCRQQTPSFCLSTVPWWRRPRVRGTEMQVGTVTVLESHPARGQPAPTTFRGPECLGKHTCASQTLETHVAGATSQLSVHDPDVRTSAHNPTRGSAYTGTSRVSLAVGRRQRHRQEIQAILRKLLNS